MPNSSKSMPPCKPALIEKRAWSSSFSIWSPSRHHLQSARHFLLEPRIERIEPQAIKIIGHSAHARADRHFVVVEDYEHPLLEAAEIIQRLENDARGGTLRRRSRPPNDGFVGPLQIVPAFQTQCRRHARPGVARHEQVVFALGWVGVAHQAPLGANGRELLVASSNQLVGINLVTGVPDQAVIAEIESRVQRQAGVRQRPGSRRSAPCDLRRCDTAPRASRLPTARARQATACADPSEIRSGRATRPMLMVPFQNVPGDRFQSFGLWSQSCDCRQGLSDQLFGPTSALFDSQQTREGQLAPLGVLACPFLPAPAHSRLHPTDHQ